MDEKFYEDLRGEARNYSNGVDPCHAFDHTERVEKLALKIGKEEKVDLEILGVAAILHDVAHKEQDDSKGKICHAQRGAKIAGEILKDRGYDLIKIDKVIHCIGTHRFRNNNSPLSVEAKVLYDADKLDSIGAIGLLRAASFSGSIGAKVHNPYVNSETTADYSIEDNAYREFLVKLSKIKDGMLTETGKKIAMQRHEYMVDFFERLNKEWEGEL